MERAERGEVTISLDEMTGIQALEHVLKVKAKLNQPDV